jgi:signal transduction histidine kinase/CheY-like chemotaxis protein
MRIAQRYFGALAGLATTGFVAFALVEGIAGYRETVAQISALQQAECRISAARIASFLEVIETQIREVASLPWSSSLLSRADQQEEFHRLLKLNPAILELRSLDADGRETLYVSRVNPDRITGLPGAPAAAASPLRKAALNYSEAYFADGSEPYVSLSVNAEGHAETIRAELNLQFVADVVISIEASQVGTPYIVDRAGHLIAHPNASLVHRKVDLSHLPQLQRTQSVIGESEHPTTTTLPQGSTNAREVLVSSVYLASPGWVMLLEQPISEVMAPVRANLYRILTVLAALLVIGFLASILLARRLTRPIIALRSGAARLGKGELETRVQGGSNDEIDALAGEFNRMATNLQESYADLELKVDVRTRALGEASAKVRRQADELAELNQELNERLDELGVKKEEADRASIAKTRFLAAASHDLRQPMHAISLLVGVLADRLNDSEVRDLVAKVQSSVKAMEDLFGELLDISRLDAGAVKPALDSFPVNGLLEVLELKYAPLAEEKRVQLHVRPSSCVIRSDARLLERIIGNLISNAIRYADGGRVVVGCRRHADAITILVLDNGIGIPLDKMSDIFEEFVQLANPERDRSKGLGLGLSIVKRTAALLGHPLIATSRVGGGSVFGIRVPRDRTHAVRMAVHATPQAPGALRGAFIVIIDDDRESRYAMEVLFSQCGCHVLAAASASEAEAMLKKHLRTPDLIVTDYRLRDGRSGLQAVRDLRAAAEWPVPGIIVTGDVGVTDAAIESMMSLGLLHKPARSEQLRNVAEMLIRSSPAAGVQPANPEELDLR